MQTNNLKKEALAYRQGDAAVEVVPTKPYSTQRICDTVLVWPGYEAIAENPQTCTRTPPKKFGGGDQQRNRGPGWGTSVPKPASL